MTCRSIGLFAVVLIGSAAASPSDAQEAVDDFEQLRALLVLGERVRVADSEGRTFTVTVESVAGSRLAVTSISACRWSPERGQGGWGPQNAQPAKCPASATLGAEEVVTISRLYPDPLWNGAAIGFGVLLIVNVVTRPLQDWDGDESARTRAWTTGALVGTAVGLLLDVSEKDWRVIYQSPESGSSGGMSVMPYSVGGNAGVSFQWRF